MIDFKDAPLFPLKWNRGFFLSVVLFLMGSALLRAQNTALVFSPEVIAGEGIVDFRMGYDPDANRWVYRNHIQYGFSDSFMLRGLTLHTIDSSDRWGFRFFRVEGLWQFLEDENAGWDSALRFELEIAEGDNLPNRIRLAWTGMYDIDRYWQVRGNFLTGYEIGPASDPGALFEVRAQVSRRLTKTTRLAFDYFGNMNNTEAFGNWESQRHQLGPTLSVKLSKTINVIGGALFGISQAAADSEYRVLVMRIF